MESAADAREIGGAAACYLVIEVLTSWRPIGLSTTEVEILVADLIVGVSSVGKGMLLCTLDITKRLHPRGLSIQFTKEQDVGGEGEEVVQLVMKNRQNISARYAR